MIKMRFFKIAQIGSNVFNTYKFIKRPSFKSFQMLNNYRCNVLQTQPKSFFHTSKSVNAIPPIIWMAIKPVAKFFAILTGRGFRKWWQALPKEKNLYFLSIMKKNRMRIIGFSSIIGASSGYYYISHLQDVPFSERKKFVAFTSDQLQQITDLEFQSIWEEYESKVIPVSHPSFKRVARATMKLLDANSDIPKIQKQKWKIVVVEDPSENAFVLPNGHIFVFTGMLKMCTNDSQLGFVIGHEIAHVVMEHAFELVSLTHVIDLMMIIVIAAIWAFLPLDSLSVMTQWFCNKVTQVLMHLPYNRMLEHEADELGLILSAKACFDVRESSAFWTKMEIVSNLKNENIPEWLSTHPSHERRSENLDLHLPEALKLRAECKCDTLKNIDPREEVAKFKAIVEKSIKPVNRNYG